MEKPKPYRNLEEDPLPILSVNEIDFSSAYSYASYMRFAFDERMELIKGFVHKMSPAPTRIHQKILTNIFGPLYIHLKNKPCEVYTAPFDVRLATKEQPDKDIFNVVQPDIVVVCDPNKLDDRGCIGAPDIVIEILSPGNHKKELIYKYEIYEEAGVKEYWIVNPMNVSITQYLIDHHYKFSVKNTFSLNKALHSPILPGFNLPLDEIFND